MWVDDTTSNDVHARIVKVLTVLNDIEFNTLLYEPGRPILRG